MHKPRVGGNLNARTKTKNLLRRKMQTPEFKELAAALQAGAAKAFKVPANKIKVDLRMTSIPKSHQH